MIYGRKFRLNWVIMLTAVSTTFPSNAHCGDNPFWVSPDGLEIVIQSADKNETYYFNNDESRKCYTFRIMGKWHPSSQSISLLQVRKSEYDDRLAVGSGGEMTSWEGANAGIYLYSPSELILYEGNNPIERAAAGHASLIEQRFDSPPSTENLVPFECSWKNAKKWTAEWSILLDGEQAQMGDEKVFIDLDQGWVAQITYGISDTLDSNKEFNNINEFIKTLKITATPKCYLPYIYENFQPDVGLLASGLSALHFENFPKALKNLKPLAEKGYVQAQIGLGWIYEAGLGVPTNYDEAVKWFKLAAEQGEPNAQFHLGHCYASGLGVPEDFSNAAEWYLASAEQGNASAQYNLGLFYAEGIGVKQDNSKALNLFILAGEQGLPQAQFNVGVFYDGGLSVPEDDAEAAKWYLSAAMLGFPLAQVRIAYMHAFGEGVEQDFIEAYAWYHVAAQSDADLFESRDWVSQQLSFMEKRKAKRRADELLQIVTQHQ